MNWTQVVHHWCEVIGAEIVRESRGFVLWIWHTDGGHPGPLGIYPTLKEAKQAAEAEAARRGTEEDRRRHWQAELEASLFGASES